MLKKDNSKIMIYGYHGQGNYGDDVFAKLIVDQLFIRFGISNVFYKSGVHSSPLDQLAAKKIYGLSFLKRLNWILVFFYTMRSKALVFCAGSLFVSQSFFLFWLTIRLVRLIKRNKVRIVALGVSIGPIESRLNRFFVKNAFKYFDVVGVRDEESYSYVYRHNVLFTNDIAIPEILRAKSELEPIVSKRHHNFTLGISINESAVGSDFYEQMISFVAEDKSIDKIIVFNPCIDKVDGDFDSAMALIARINGIRGDVIIELVAHDPKNLQVIDRSICECSLIFASRMHIGIASRCFGVPLVQYAYAEKVKNVFKSLGIEDSIFDEKLSIKELVALSVGQDQRSLLSIADEIKEKTDIVFESVVQ